MNKLKTILIDDEDDARFLIRNTISKHFPHEITIVAEADDIETGIKVINENEADVVFLDIKLRNGTGFDLLKKIKEKKFEVVFITAYNQYAVKAFQFSAIGYLLKPIKVKDLEILVENIRKRFEKHKISSERRLRILEENYQNEKVIKKMVISNMEGFKVVALEDIIRLEGDRNYTHFFTLQDKKYTASKTIGEYEALLSEYGFFRIHQSTIINLMYVSAYKKGEDGWVEMKDGVKLQISRYRRNDFLKKFI